MTVKRIVTNIGAADFDAAKAFYGGTPSMDVVMDRGWIASGATGTAIAAQVSIARNGGSGPPVPDLSIDVDDLNEVQDGPAEAGVALEYGPVTPPRGVRGGHVRDPFGRLLSIPSHG